MALSPSMSSLIFNVAGGAVLLTVVGYMAVSYVTTPVVEACSTRFPGGQKFSFSGNNGRPLSAVELQGRTGTREWGLLKNAKVIAGAGSSAINTLEVTLASTDNEDQINQNGIGFTWSVPGLEKASAACLSYSVYLPKGFKFKEAGVLPGLYGAHDVAQIDVLKPEDGFATRMGWAESGDLGVDVRVPKAGGHFEGPRRKTLWETGRWISVEQEARLNVPGKANGILRVWIDGGLVINREGLALRQTAETPLSGVVADIGYTRTKSDVAAFRISPFVVQAQ